MSSSASAGSSSAAATEPGVRATLECLSIEGPPGAAKTTSQTGGLMFKGGPKMKVGDVAYEPSFTVSTQAAEGASASAFKDELMKTFARDYAEVARLSMRDPALRAARLLPPKASALDVAGIPGHVWQVDSLAAFNGGRVPWRALSITTVYRDRVYVVTAASALASTSELEGLASRYFISVRFDACP